MINRKKFIAPGAWFAMTYPADWHEFEGGEPCAYSCEVFTEDGEAYENHQWVTGIGDVAFEVSFATAQGASIRKAQEVIASLELRYPGVKYHAELIPIRLMEIYQIDEAYDWVQSEIKKQFKKDFRGEVSDIQNMQHMIDNGSLNPRKRDAWIALGITLCVILTNEILELHSVSIKIGCSFVAFDFDF